MPLIIDGNNLLHSLPREEQNRSEVRRQVLETVRQQRVRVTVVFDGPPPSGTPEPVLGKSNRRQGHPRPRRQQKRGRLGGDFRRS
jgi:hypothetical protein